MKPIDLTHRHGRKRVTMTVPELLAHVDARVGEVLAVADANVAELLRESDRVPFTASVAVPRKRRSAPPVARS